MGRKIKANDSATGKEITVDADALTPGPIRHHTLPDPLLDRVRAVHSTIRDVYSVPLEQFEVGFMRDGHPEKEVAVWERITAAFEKVTRAMPDLDRKAALRTLLAYSMGALTAAERAKPEVVAIIEIAGEG